MVTGTASHIYCHRYDCCLTDDEEIYQEAVLKSGALDVGIRCERLAGDDVSKWAVWQDSLEKAEVWLAPSKQ